MRIRIKDVVYQGTPEEVVEQLRKSWWWLPLPRLEDMFELVSEYAQRPITTCEEYVQTLVALGVAKEEV